MFNVILVFLRLSRALLIHSINSFLFFQETRIFSTRGLTLLLAMCSGLVLCLVYVGFLPIGATSMTFIAGLGLRHLTLRLDFALTTCI